MITKIINSILFIITVQILLSSGCSKNDSRPCTSTSAYSFAVTGEFIPQKEVYNIGDTIYFSSTFPITQINLVNNQPFDYKNSIGISGNFNTIEMDTVQQSIESGLDNFNVFVIEGEIRPNDIINRGVIAVYKENATSYKSIIGVRLLKKGLFYIGMTNLFSQGLRGRDCTNAGFEMSITNSNKNINLFEYALGYTPDNFLAKSIFCFRVQ